MSETQFILQVVNFCQAVRGKRELGYACDKNIDDATACWLSTRLHVTNATAWMLHHSMLRCSYSAVYTVYIVDGSVQYHQRGCIIGANGCVCVHCESLGS